jgi:hypothetical protein
MKYTLNEQHAKLLIQQELRKHPGYILDILNHCNTTTKLTFAISSSELDFQFSTIQSHSIKTVQRIFRIFWIIKCDIC